MLAPTDVDALNTIAHELAHRTFAGRGSVVRSGNGAVRLTLAKNDSEGGGLYRMREMSALTYEVAAKDISLAIESVSNP